MIRRFFDARKGRASTVSRKVISGFVVSCVMVFAIATAALADNVVNDISSVGDKTIVAGASTAIGYQITKGTTSGSDTESGCNASDGTPATMTVHTPSGVTATPSTLTFTACNSFKDVTFSSSTAGTYDITVTVADDGTSGTYGYYNTGPAKFTLTVNPAPEPVNDPPVVTVPGDMTVEGNITGGAVVTYSASASDTEDGPLTPSCVPASGSFFALGGPTAVTCSATDSKGATSSKSFNVTVVDTTDPTISGTPSDISVKADSTSGSTVSYTAPTASDIVDSDVPVGCVPVSGALFAVGATTVACTAIDDSGNDATSSFLVNVNYDLRGFFAPVDMSGVLNSVKAGATVPLKFNIPGRSGGYISDLGVVSTFKTYSINCDQTAPVDPIEVTTTGGTSLRYDLTANQYIQNWQTPKSGVGTCRRAEVALTDGTKIHADFKLK